MKKIILLLSVLVLFQTTKAQIWTPLPGGSLNGQVNTMISFGGYRWFSGSFSTAGPISSIAIARHNGFGWVPTPILQGSSFSFCIWNDTLYGAGSFLVGPVTYGAVKWNGSGWDYFGVIPSGYYFHTVTVFNNHLVFGGRCFSVDGVPINHIAKWDGSAWSAFPFTITCSWATLPNIRVVKTINNYLHIGGDFNYVDLVSAVTAFKTDGTSIIPMSLEPNYYVADFAKYHDSTFCTGNFTFGPFPFNDGSPGIVKTENTTWRQVGHGLKLRGLSLSSSAIGLYASGQYNNVCYNTPCNHADVGNLGLWNGTSWSNQSAGLFADGNESVNFVYTDTLTNLTYAIGDFHTTRGDAADYVAVRQTIPLPVGLSKFDAKLGADNNITVSWQDQTPSSQNRFEVQLSTDGTHFSKIGFVQGNDYINVYSYNYKPPNCGQYFFRLSFDNGNISDVRYVNIPCPGPKIVAGKQSLTITTITSGTLTLISPQGQTLARTVLASGDNKVLLMVPPGLYIARFVDTNAKLYTQKVFIQ